MITNNGKELIGKYLLGQAPQYATHISIGCGATPLNATPSSELIQQIRQKQIMDFEMTRVPITSKGFVEENGITKISFSAELPTENRYDITEVAFWSAGRNNLATNSDSRIIYNFSEPWEQHGSVIQSIPYLTNIGTEGDITTSEKIFSVSNNDINLRNESRANRREGPRYLNRSILVRGDTSKINGPVKINSASANGTTITYNGTHTFNVGDIVTITGFAESKFNINRATINSVDTSNPKTFFTVSSNILSSTSTSGGAAWKPGTWLVDEVSSGVPSTHIHLNNTNFGLNFNSPADRLKLALCVVPVENSTTAKPHFVKILVEFYRNEISTTTGYAKAELLLSSSDLANSYCIADIPLSNLITTPDFTFSEVRICRFFISAVTSSQSIDSSFYIALDGFRVDNISTENPLYKMVGYSIVKNIEGLPITKYQNTNNYIEFRMSLDLT